MSIKIDNVVLLSPEQWEAIIRGMRNPLNSWDKSDSRECNIDTCIGCDNECYERLPQGNEKDYVIGKNDADLMKRLNKAGTEHRKFMRMITVYMDITAPLYWWKEFDTYKVGTVCNSCSTMHKIAAKKFTLDDFSDEHLRCDGLFCDSMNALKHTINVLNFWRDRYNESDEERQNYFEQNGYPSVPSKKDCWWQMIQLLPSSYNQKRTIMLNYEVLASMYHQRKNHKLDEWREFCEWIKTLPCSELITGEEDE